MSFTFQNPFAYFNNPANSNPVGLGNLYIGLPDTDPITPANQVPVFAVQPDGSELQIPQPVRMTAGGVLTYNGTPIQLKLDENVYSVKVTSSAGAQLYYTARTYRPDSYSCDNIKSLGDMPLEDGRLYNVTSFFDGWASELTPPKGGGMFVYSDSTPKSKHDGGTYLAPEAIRAWDGTKSNLSVLFSSGGAGDGCFVRLFEKDVMLSFFGGVLDGVQDDTLSLSQALSSVGCTVGVSGGGVQAGKPLVVDVGNAIIAGNISVSRPCFVKGAGSGQFTDSSERSKITHTGTGKLFDFTIDAGYCDWRDLSLYGNKTGVVNIGARSFGNVGITIGQGAAGVFDGIYFENFDIGYLAYRRDGGSDFWGGAYRHLNHCKFRNNFYSTAVLDLVTEANFNFCDFRSNNLTGYIYIETADEPNNYNSTIFNTCMFELLGTDGAPDFSKAGIQILGVSYVKFIGGYLEKVSVFVDRKAQLLSSAYHRWQSGPSLKVYGGGYIDIDKTFGSTRDFKLPPLDSSQWVASNVTKLAIDRLGSKLTDRFQITSTTSPSLEITNITDYFKLSIDCAPHSLAEYAILQIGFDYYTPAGVGKSVNISPAMAYSAGSTVTPPVSTYTDVFYYDNGDAEWKRKVYNLPVPLSNGTGIINAFRPAIFFIGSTVGDVYGVKNITMKIISI